MCQIKSRLIQFRWEKKGEIYRRFGIRFFARFVAGGVFWQRLNLARPKWKKANVSGYLRDSKILESAHLVSFIILLIASVALLFKQAPVDAFIIFIANFFFNVIPITVCRFNRHRIVQNITNRQRRLMQNKDSANLI